MERALVLVYAHYAYINMTNCKLYHIMIIYTLLNFYLQFDYHTLYAT